VIFFGFICPPTARIIQLMFCYRFKWITVLLCYAVWITSVISWAAFFGFNRALYNAGLCPGTTEYTPSPFPVGNLTYTAQDMFCSSFSATRLDNGSFGASWVWGPSVGWFFALGGSFLSFIILCIMLTIEVNDDPTYEDIPDESTRMTKRRDRGRDRGGRGDREGRQPSRERTERPGGRDLDDDKSYGSRESTSRGRDRDDGGRSSSRSRRDRDRSRSRDRDSIGLGVPEDDGREERRNSRRYQPRVDSGL